MFRNWKGAITKSSYFVTFYKNNVSRKASVYSLTYILWKSVFFCFFSFTTTMCNKRDSTAISCLRLSTLFRGRWRFNSIVQSCYFVNCDQLPNCYWFITAQSYIFFVIYPLQVCILYEIIFFHWLFIVYNSRSG